MELLRVRSDLCLGGSGGRSDSYCAAFCVHGGCCVCRAVSGACLTAACRCRIWLPESSRMECTGVVIRCIKCDTESVLGIDSLYEGMFVRRESVRLDV